jgi:hypothetical protein
MYLKNIKIKDPLMLYMGTKLLIAAIGVLISFISFVRLIKLIKNLVKDKIYVGNELYLVSAIIMLIICLAILIWASRSLIPVIIKTYQEYKSPEDWEFEDYEKVEKALRQNKLPSYKKPGSKTIYDRDLTFIILFLSFLGILILFLLGKSSIPNEFFWKHNLTPDFFSFPLDFTAILAAAAGLRTASFFLHTHKKEQEEKVSESKEKLKIEGDPYMLAPVIEEALTGIRYNEKPNINSRSGFTGTEGIDKKIGRTEKKLFIETHPKHVPYEPHPIVYIYLLFALILYIIGILLMTQLPPDNISVLAVPTIAIGYLWSILKGGILVFCGWDMMKSVSNIYRTHWFESILVFVEVNGIYREVAIDWEKTRGENPGNGRPDVQGDFHVNIYTAKLLTEIYDDKAVKKVSINKKKSGTNPGCEEKRRIVKMTKDIDSEKANRLVIDAIKKFEVKDGEE